VVELCQYLRGRVLALIRVVAGTVQMLVLLVHSFKFRNPGIKYVPMVADLLGRTTMLQGDAGAEAPNPDERFVGGRIGRSPPFSTHAHASLKFLVNIVGSDLCLTSSFTCPAARK
jgi:hypothetical protein